MTPIQNLYDAFFVILESDEWETWDEYQTENDLKHIALAAIPWFKFPRCSFELDENQENFVDDKVSNTEIQILALFMKAIWYDRVIDSWENIKPYYIEQDFSPAKQLAEFRQRSESQWANAKNLEKIYYRSINGKPFDFGSLAGG